MPFKELISVNMMTFTTQTDTHKTNISQCEVNLKTEHDGSRYYTGHVIDKITAVLRIA